MALKLSRWLAADEQKEVYARLRWAHSDERALAIISGCDPRTEADIKAWRELGRRSDAR